MRTHSGPLHSGASRRGGLATLVVIGKIVAWSLILAVVVALGLAVAAPRVAGATPYTILTGSMRPDLPPGTLVVSRPVSADRVKVGSVLTYQRASGRSDVVTHRVIEVGVDRAGEPRWRTQGDANRAADPEWVRPIQVKGELWYAVPGLGRLNQLFSNQQRRTATVAVAAGFFGYAAALWWRAGHQALRRRRTTQVML